LCLKKDYLIGARINVAGTGLYRWESSALIASECNLNSRDPLHQLL
jgi:hypothetical protein